MWCQALADHKVACRTEVTVYDSTGASRFHLYNYVLKNYKIAEHVSTLGRRQNKKKPNTVL